MKNLLSVLGSVGIGASGTGAIAMSNNSVKDEATTNTLYKFDTSDFVSSSKYQIKDFNVSKNEYKVYISIGGYADDIEYFYFDITSKEALNYAIIQVDYDTKVPYGIDANGLINTGSEYHLMLSLDIYYTPITIIE